MKLRVVTLEEFVAEPDEICNCDTPLPAEWDGADYCATCEGLLAPEFEPDYEAADQ